MTRNVGRNAKPPMTNLSASGDETDDLMSQAISGGAAQENQWKSDGAQSRNVSHAQPLGGSRTPPTSAGIPIKRGAARGVVAARNGS